MRYLIATIALLVPTFAFANDPQPKIEQVSLSVSPAAEPRPALAHSLWLAQRQRLPGNAATFYYRAIVVRRQNEAILKEFPHSKTEQWLDLPLSELPKDEVARYIDLHKHILAELRTATTRQQCEWDLRLEEMKGMELVSFLLPEMQEMRDLARMLAYKARWEVSQGHYDDAIETIRMGYQMGHDCAEPPVLICALVGIACTHYMHVAATDLIDAPGSPNLYWAYKQLPHPLVDIQSALEFELTMPYQMFPFLKDAETARRTPEEWQRLTQEAMANLNALAADTISQDKLEEWKLRLAATAMMVKAYPAAKQALAEQGMQREALEKMPVAQVVAIHAARSYRYTYEEVFKWSRLPYAEARPGIERSMARLKEEGYLGQPFSDQDVLPIASLLMPSLENVMLASAKSERRLAALETLEAIRMHAAARQGELPASLEQLAGAPAPKNPFTGRTFDYRVEQNKAVLEERSPGVDPIRASDRVYLIELIKDVK